jgi:malate dehydrogenase
MTVIGEVHVRAAATSDKLVVVQPGDIVTAHARDVAASLGVRLVEGPVELPAPFAADPGTVIRRVLARRSPRWVTPSRIPHEASDPLPRVAIVGSGAVGAATAHLVALTRTAHHVVLVDIVPGLAASTALDIEHASGINSSPTRCTGGESLDLVAEADVVVVTAGRPRSPGMSRADLAATNAEIVRSTAEAVRDYAPDATLIVVTNPLDEMTHEGLRTTGFPRERVLGMAGTLDSSRFRWALATAAGVEPADVIAFTMGSHGDEMVPIVSHATIRGRPATSVLTPAALNACVEETVGGGGRIVALRRTGSASIAPAHSITEMLQAMRGSRPGPLPVSVLLQGEYGLEGVVLGVPAELWRHGLKRVVELPLTDEELEALRRAAEAVRARTLA